MIGKKNQMKNRLLPGLRTAGLLLFILAMAASGFAQGLPTFNGKDPKVPQAEFSVVASKTKDICVGDVITLKPKAQKLAKEAMESLAGFEVPGWLELNPAELSVKVVAIPTTDQIPFDVNTNLIIEFYR